MDYNSLKYIITVNKHRSISKAADELFLTQPNISKAIQNVEKEIGFQIFTRTSRGVATTIEGKEFIDKATKLLKEFEEFSKSFTNTSNKNATINISIPSTIYFTLLLSKFIQNNSISEIKKINITEGSSEEIIDNVIKEVSSIGIICVNDSELAYYKHLLLLNNLEILTVNSFKLQIVINANNPLSKLNFINEKNLENQVIVINNKIDYSKYSNFNKINTNAKFIKVPGGFNQLLMVSKLENSFMFSPPLPVELLEKNNCVNLEFESNSNNKWHIILLKNKNKKLLHIENEIITFFKNNK